MQAASREPSPHGKLVYGLVPAFQPAPALVPLLEQVLADGDLAGIVVVDDGSDASCAPVFQQAAALPRVTVLRHHVNLGKGAALRTGINAAACAEPDLDGIVTFDADGQHLPGDIQRVAATLQAGPGTLVLGSRQFEAEVPWRSRFGNTCTRILFRLLSGLKLQDTQTGLRGIPSQLFPALLHLRSNKYEFELQALLVCKQQHVPIREVPIQTIYLDRNEASHFRPMRDSMLIYFTLFRYALASLGCALLDILLFALLYHGSGQLAASVFLARAVSLGVNYAAVKSMVFHSGRPVRHTLPAYGLLALVTVLLSYGLTWVAVSRLRFDAVLAKIVIDGLLFFMNFFIQRDLIFSQETRST